MARRRSGGVPKRVAGLAMGMAIAMGLAGSFSPLSPVMAEPRAWNLATIGSFTFTVSPYSVHELPASEGPMEGSTIVPPYGTRSPAGYALFKTDGGRLVDHPVAQAQYVVNMLRDNRLTGDPQYLAAAVANAERLLERAVTVDGALFFPYPFNWPLFGDGALAAPWYSGMAQGIALAGFVRLFERTGETRWRTAADATFASFLVPKASGRPWVTTVDGDLLWFEEYPWSPPNHTFNGHVFALYGIYDYWRLTRDPLVEALVRGGLATAQVAGEVLRVPGGVSRYCVGVSCLVNDIRNPHYHALHIGQFRELYKLTDQAVFLELADALAADQPAPR